jgi:hypothetical protein
MPICCWFSAPETTVLSSAVVTPELRLRQMGLVACGEWKPQLRLTTPKTSHPKQQHLFALLTAKDDGMAARLHRPIFSPIAV